MRESHEEAGEELVKVGWTHGKMRLVWREEGEEEDGRLCD